MDIQSGHTRPPLTSPCISGIASDDEYQDSQSTLQPPSPLRGPVRDESDAFLPETSKEHASHSDPTKLHRTGYVLFLVVLYATAAIFAWVLVCILVYRPITTNTYSAQFRSRYGYANDHQVQDYRRNQSWYRVATVIQSIVSVLTIPLTSTVCSSAAVIFMQQKAGSPDFTLRQLLALADKGWTDPAIYLRMTRPTGWTRYGSVLLVFSIFLNILGALIAPIQQIFLSSKTIKTPTELRLVSDLLDVPTQINEGYFADDRIPLHARLALQSTMNDEPQVRLWQGGNFSCSKANAATPAGSSGIYDITLSCKSGNTLANMNQLVDPFLAELPSDFNTGLVRQFIPRINSTASYKNISAQEYPQGCSTLPGAFYVQYTNPDPDTAWTLEACMPNNQSSPWKPVRSRQDFNERLFINITSPRNRYDPAMPYYVTPPGGYQVYIQLNTTVGYFELPNYMNGQIAGPLLAADPNDHCGKDCHNQGGLISDHPELDKREAFANHSMQGKNLEWLANPGPLLIVAMALFGNGSFFDNRVRRSTNLNISAPDCCSCIELAPLSGLWANSNPDLVLGAGAPSCIRTTTSTSAERELDRNIKFWILRLVVDPYKDSNLLSNTFTATAFLANQVWLTRSTVGRAIKPLTVASDPGEDTLVPTISLVGIIFISSLLIIFLGCLFATALYGARYARWTHQLDSFAMLRLGSSIAEKVPLMVGKDIDKVHVLDQMPGSIGGVLNGEDVASLALGGTIRVDGKQLYECYHQRSLTKHEERVARQQDGVGEIRARKAAGRRAKNTKSGTITVDP